MSRVCVGGRTEARDTGTLFYLLDPDGEREPGNAVIFFSIKLSRSKRFQRIK